jgi:hypothetical protein
MHLPDLQLQFIYARLAWGIVLATLLIGLWPRRFALSRPMLIGIVVGMVGLQALPGSASPTYALGLAFQSPSGLLLGLCLAKLYLAAHNAAQREIMPLKLAFLLAGTGVILYLDAMGLIALGLYYWGFGPYAAPLASLLLAIGAAVAIARGRARPQAMALLVALMSFAILRLPTGNIWDALFDPLLWLWALWTLARHARQRWLGKRRQQQRLAAQA